MKVTIFISCKSHVINEHNKLCLCHSQCLWALYFQERSKCSGSPNPSSIVHSKAHYNLQQNNAQPAAALYTPHTPSTNTHPTLTVPVGTAARTTPENNRKRKCLCKSSNSKKKEIYIIVIKVQLHTHCFWCLSLMLELFA